MRKTGNRVNQRFQRSPRKIKINDYKESIDHFCEIKREMCQDMVVTDEAD